MPLTLNEEGVYGFALPFMVIDARLTVVLFWGSVKTIDGALPLYETIHSNRKNTTTADTEPIILICLENFDFFHRYQMIATGIVINQIWKLINTSNPMPIHFNTFLVFIGFLFKFLAEDVI
jgi:hypothetical protein